MFDEAVDCSPPLACPHGSIVMESTPYGVIFRPSPKRIASLVRLLFIFAFCFPLILAALVILFEGRMLHSIGGVVSLVAFGLLVTGSAFGAAWSCRNSPVIPLIVEPTGRVLYRTKVLLEVGANPSFYIESRDGGGEGDSVMYYSVVASNRWGPLVGFPSPWFDEFDDPAVALWFARQLEAAVRSQILAPVTGEAGRSATLEFGSERQDNLNVCSRISE